MPTVSLVGRAIGQNSSVSRGNMCMRSQDGGHAAIQIPAHSDFFRSGFRMKIHEDHFAGNFASSASALRKGIVSIMHKDASLQVDDGKILALRQRAFIQTNTRDALSIICRTQHLARPAFRIAVG